MRKVRTRGRKSSIQGHMMKVRAGIRPHSKAMGLPKAWCRGVRLPRPAAGSSHPFPESHPFKEEFQVRNPRYQLIPALALIS